MRRFSILFTALLLLGFFVKGQKQDFMQVNNIKAYFLNNGEMFRKTPKEPGFEVPANSGLHTIFVNTVWIGGIDEQGELHIAAQTYRQQKTKSSDFFSGPMADSYDVTYDTKYDNLWKIHSRQIREHRKRFNDTGYSIPEVIRNWPAHGDTTNSEAKFLAPFVDSNKNNIYDPENGDYPDIRGDGAIYFLLNDDRKDHGETGGRPLGVEIHGMAYAFNKPRDTAINNTIFLNLNIYNRSRNKYKDVYLGNFVDFDLGYAFDDYVGCDTANELFYAYNGDIFDSTNTGYGTTPPAQGTSFLSSPLSSFVYYNYLLGKWKDGEPMTKGGNGRGGKEVTRFLYSGDPLVSDEWSEESEKHIPFDRRGLGVSGPFILESGEHICLDLAYTFARDHNALDTNSRLKSITKLKSFIREVHDFYNKQNYDCPEIEIEYSGIGKERIERKTLEFYPNPVTDDLRVEIPPGFSGLLRLKIYDPRGRMVLHRNVKANTPRPVILNTKQLPGGIYYLRMNTNQHVFHG